MVWAKKTLLFLFFIFSYTILHAQLTLTGKVTDAKTGKPVPGVNIYLANTTIGASTNGEGVYQISDIPSGIHVLVFSYVGYKTKTFHLTVKNASSSLKKNVKLLPRTLEMDEIRVVDSNEEWKRNFRRFKKAFIGQTEFAERTIIQNPYILSFTETAENDNLIATTSEPLIITNKALGYKIYAVLVAFKWSKYRDTGAYKIYLKYEPLTPQNKRQEKFWWENRIKTYLGSFTQFFRKLHSDNIKNSPFSISGSWNLSSLTSGETKFELFELGLSKSMTKLYKGFELDNKIQVNYRNRVRYKFYDQSVTFSIEKHSSISSNKKNELFFVDKNGKLLDPASVITYGDWARSRVASSLPENYKIGN